MEKAIVKTLAYYDLFDFPLKAWEVHKWLIGSNASLLQVEKTLNRLLKKSKVQTKSGFWFLPKRPRIIKARLTKEQVSRDRLRLAKQVGWIIKTIPTVKMVGISGSLAVMGSSKTDDIDLFIVTSKNRIWLTRLCLISILLLTGLRRSRREKILSAAGKICINLILEEDNLAQDKRNIYLAHEVLQMRPLWQKSEIYSDFLHANSWAFKYLPNWKSSQKMESKNWKNGKNSQYVSSKFLDLVENLAKKLQLKIMKKPSGQERIKSGALYFHPEDKGIKILAEYKRRLKNLSLA